MKDYYKILEVDKFANIITIKKAYRKLSLKLHPDINKATDSHDKFIEINEAYQVLNNPIRRKQYDLLYNYYINNKSQQPISNKKYTQWKSNVNRSTRKGQARGKKYASESGRNFKNRAEWWDAWIIIDVIMQLLSSVF